MRPAELDVNMKMTESFSAGKRHLMSPERIAQEDDLIQVRTLFHDLYASLTKAETAVVYDDPGIGTKLRASSTLRKDGETLTYSAKVDRLNPADAERFVTEETLDPVVGTAEEIRANYAGLFAPGSSSGTASRPV